MKPFESKVVIITGGSSGIGKATALQLAEQGASVVLASRNSCTGEEVVNDITAMGGKAVKNKLRALLKTLWEFMDDWT